MSPAPRILLAFAFSLGAALAVETVTTLADDGPGSLREAIDSASAGEAIEFAPGLNGGTITLESNLVLTRAVTIDASDLPGGVILSGGGSTRIFAVTTVSPVVLKRLTLRDGAEVGGAAISSFAAIDLTLEECEIRDNVSTRSGSGDSGAVFLGSGSCTAVRSSFIGNSATSSGGNADGGALVVSPGGSFTGTNCTFAHNTCDGEGGAIKSWGTVNLFHCTVSKNAAGPGPNAGGGIYWSGSLTARHCILAGNVGDDNVSPLAGMGGGANWFLGDPVLSDAATFGGPTRTLMPLPGSPVIDVAELSAETPASDQRGTDRPAAYFPGYDVPLLDHDEAVEGDLPGTIGTSFDLGPGTNVIRGTVGPTGTGEAQDQFALNLGTGLKISSVTLELDVSGGTTGFVDFEGSTVSTSGGAVTETFDPPLTAGSYNVNVVVNFAIASKPWEVTVVVEDPPTGNDVGAVETTWDEGIVFSPPAGYASATDITGPRDAAVAYPSEDLVDGFTSAAQVINNAGGHLAVYAPRRGGLTVSPRLGASTLYAMVLRNRNDLDDSNAFDPASFVLLGSMDGVRFEPIASDSVPAFFSPGGGWIYYFDPQPPAYRHFRLLFTSVIDEPNSFDTVQIGEVELIGIPEDTSLRILDFSVNPTTKVFDLTFCSTPGVDHTIEYDAELDFVAPNYFVTPISGSSVTEWSHRVTGIALGSGRDFLRVKDE